MQTRTRKGWLVLAFLSFAASAWSAGETGGGDPTWTYGVPNAASECPAGAEACDAWIKFRTTHPWPYQSIAAARRGDETVVILSEAPPNLSRAEVSELIRATFGDTLIGISRLRWQTGLDGWLEDAVIRIKTPVMSNVDAGSAPKDIPQSVADRLTVIAQIFFGTADGFQVDDVDMVASAADRCRVGDIEAGPAEIARWLAAPDAWRSLDSVVSVGANDLRTGKTAGAFAREDGLLVAFVIPKQSKLDDLRASFRRFAVFSDTIVGASRPKNGNVILLARGRTTPQTCLPPIRFETFQMLSRTRNKQLAQSYERQRIFAGKISEGIHQGWDWAPIYLSGELDDTEFGTLLNLADQVLKSWSEHGSISYFAFDYSPPETYPFGDVSASGYFSSKFNTSSLIFNWNTSGLALKTSFPSGDTLVTVDRTGALPILYVPSGGLADAATLPTANKKSQGTDSLSQMFRQVITEDAEKQARLARAYFATQGDPLLARVVQNVTLYQVARAFAKATGTPAVTSKSRSDLTVSTLRTEATRWITDVATGANTRGLSAGTRAAIKDLLRTSKMTPAQMAEFIATPESAVQRFASVEARRRDLETAVATEGPPLKMMSSQYETEFKGFCDEVRGAIVPVDETQEKCEYKDEGEQYARRAAALRRMGELLEQKMNDFLSLAKSMEAADAEVARLVADFEAAQKLGEALQGEAQFVSNLGAVLESVQRAVASSLSTGTIRTPALVMSKNTDDIWAIGGHNIDSAATHVQVVSGSVAPHFEGSSGNRVLVVSSNRLADAPSIVAKVDRLPSAPGRPVREALKMADNEPQTLLDTFRQRTTDADAAIRHPELLEAAESCECDILISQDASGVIRMVRNDLAPPVIRELRGRTGVIDAIAGPPPARTVRFEGMQAQSVEYFAQSVALSNRANSRGNGISRVINSIQEMFSKEGGVGKLITLVNRPKRAPEFLRTVDEGGGIDRALKEIELASTKSVQPLNADLEEIAQTAGLSMPRPESVSPVAVVVRFPRVGDNFVVDVVGVYAELPVSTPTSARKALETVANTEFAKRTGNKADLAEKLGGLADAIRSQLKPSELHFFKRSKFSVPRVAQNTER
jgi:hypothetical protein